MALAVTLVWAAWPTVATALDVPDAPRDAATGSPATPGAPISVSTSTTVSVPPPSTATAPPVPVTDAPAPTEAPAPPAPPAPATDPPVTNPPVTDPPPAPSAASVAVASTSGLCDGVATAVLDAMNRDRAGNGVGPLCANAQLTGIAQAWADHLAQTQTFVHQDLLAVISATPFHLLAENLLAGPSPLITDQIEGAWMASSGHREHILDGSLVAAGVGTAISADGRLYVVVDFGGNVTA